MFVLANLIQALATVTTIVLNIIWWLVLIRALISWVNPDPFNPVVQFLYKTTEPILEPVRRLLPESLRFGIDISPLVVFLIIYFLRAFVVPTLVQLSYRLIA